MCNAFLKLNILDSLTYKTISANKETVDKNWVIVDASGHALGRMCSKIAKLIRGKYKPALHLMLTVEITLLLLMQKKLVSLAIKRATKHTSSTQAILAQQHLRNSIK